MTRVRISPYKPGSESAKVLAKRLNLLRVKPESTRFVAKNGDVVINWGSSKKFWLKKNGHNPRVLNRPEAVAAACDKLKTFKILSEKGVSVPAFTTSKEEAKALLTEKVCRRVFCRTKLTAHSGQGIIVARTPEEIVDAALYVVGIPKKSEFRVHVANGQVFDTVEKKAIAGASTKPNWNPDIRSYTNGWVFVREGVNAPNAVKSEAISAVNALGLDFAAVDVCVDAKTGQAFILEVNTSPALQNTTLENYAKAIESLL